LHNEDLLDRLHRLTGSEYLSELKSPAYRETVLRELERIEVSDYPLHEWREALSYLFGAEAALNTEKDVAAFIRAQNEKRIEMTVSTSGHGGQK